MKAIQLASFGIIPAALFLLACGDDVTKVTKIEETSGLEVVASADSLGKCSEEISGEMKFATKENAVYVCADSAWKNVSETKKTTCSAEALSDSSGFKIVCGRDSIGVLKNGANGTDGEKGDDGKDGESCKLAEGPVLEEGNSLVQTSFVICGSDTLTLSDGHTGEDCELADNGDGTVSVTCGETASTLYKALCGNKPFDPDSSFCFGDSVVAYCDGMLYNLNSSFCFNGSIVPLAKKFTWDLMNPEIEYETFTDERDGQIYRMINIGEQIWMAENLNYADNQDASSSDSSSFCYNNGTDFCAKYGRLYTWDAAMKACPEGWHLPDTTAWDELASFIGGKTKSPVGKALKTVSGWKDYTAEISGNGTDEFGFSALPGGFNSAFKSSDEETLSAYFWTSDLSAKSSKKANARSLSNATTVLTPKDQEPQAKAYSVRCVKD